MPEPAQTEIDVALHHFGQRARAAWAERQATFEQNIAAFRGGISEDWQQEREAAKGLPKISPPEPDKDKDEPDLGR